MVFLWVITLSSARKKKSSDVILRVLIEFLRNLGNHLRDCGVIQKVIIIIISSSSSTKFAASRQRENIYLGFGER